VKNLYGTIAAAGFDSFPDRTELTLIDQFKQSCSGYLITHSCLSKVVKALDQR